MMLELRLALVFISLVASIKCTMEPFVVGGQTAKITDFPHSVFIKARCIKNNSTKNVEGWSCGASIVNEKIILTAAHCLEAECAHMDVSANVGHANRRKGFECSVIDYIIHPDFNGLSSADNDIAIAKLKRTLKFDETIKRIAIMKNPPYYEKAQIAGWGLIADNAEQISDDLMYTDLWVVNREICKHRIKIPQKTFCAKHSTGGYTAEGDSGSALVVRGYIQIGIISLSYKRSKEPLSSVINVFTDTGEFYDWIVKSTKNLYCAKVEGN